MLNNDKDYDNKYLKCDTEIKPYWSLVEGKLSQPGWTLTINDFGDLSGLI